MDNFLLQSVVDEIAAQINGQRIGRVFQPNGSDLVIDLRIDSGKSLFIRTHPDQLAVYLAHRATRDESSQQQLPTFAVQLRKAFGSARVIRFEKLGDDRVVDLEFGVKTARGSNLRLAISLVGRSADVQLVEDEVIVGSLRSRDIGKPYRLPQPIRDRFDPIELPDQKWLELIEDAGNDVAVAAARLIGFTSVYCEETAFLSRSIGPVRALHRLVNTIRNAPQPAIYSNVSIDTLRAHPGINEAQLILAAIRFEHLDGLIRTPFDSLCAAADAYYSVSEERKQVLDQRRDWATRLRAQHRKHLSLLEKLKRDFTNCQYADRDQRLGEILLANLHNFSRAGAEFIVKDYFVEGEPEVHVPDMKTDDPRIAAESYFKRARRARRASVEISKRLAETESQVSKTTLALLELESATNVELLNSLGPLERGRPQARERRNRGEGKKEAISGVRRYRSSDGMEILVGRTDRDNDNLTLKVARSSDLWFHAADYPGSHVVLRNPQKKTIPPTSIREAAELAAKFSQAKNDTKVAVNYCERKFVSKPKGFAPGQVRLSSFKTILVEPRESAERLL